jgi:hypothetical protein
VFSLGLNSLPRIVFTLVKSHIKNTVYDASNRWPFDVKWRELDFTLLISSVLQFDHEIEFWCQGVPQMKYHLVDFFHKSKDFTNRQN